MVILLCCLVPNLTVVHAPPWANVRLVKGCAASMALILAAMYTSWGSALVQLAPNSLYDWVAVANVVALTALHSQLALVRAPSLVMTREIK